MNRLVLFTLALALLAGAALASDASSSSPEDPRGLKFEGVYYLSYQTGSTAGVDYSSFDMRRAYLTVKKNLTPILSSRLTLDVTRDQDGDGRGDVEVRVKYAYADFKLPDLAFLTKPNIEFGVVHTPWLDFEEHIDYYRLREKMFAERSGVFNSADFGATFGALLGGTMPEDYQKTVSGKYPGRYGSVALGLYNGGGYHALEENQNKVFQGRLTIRPVPDALPGLQVSALTILGEGNQPGDPDQTPDWTALLAMASYETAWFVATADLINGAGNQKGSWTKVGDATEARPYSGWSLFGEGKLGTAWRVIGGFDSFDPDSDADDDEYIGYYVGAGYDFGHHTMLLLDYSVKDYAQTGVDNDQRTQLTMGVNF